MSLMRHDSAAQSAGESWMMQMLSIQMYRRRVTRQASRRVAGRMERGMPSEQRDAMLAWVGAKRSLRRSTLPQQ
jgi:hypothetical protein